MSEKIWSDDAWDDYLYWQTQDKKTLKRINLLIKDIERNKIALCITCLMVKYISLIVVGITMTHNV